MPTVYLIRHGEVANPNHVCYATMPGFNLSPLGVLQAHATGRHLADHPLDLVLTSPLARAVQTATAIGRHHDVPVQVDDRLIETGQLPHWTGMRWDDIARVHADELAQYLEDATRVEGSVETIDEIAERGTRAIGETVANGHDHVAVVGHQDATQAARLALSGRPLSELRLDPPPHAAVITLVSSGATWVERSVWVPDESSPVGGLPAPTSSRS